MPKINETIIQYKVYEDGTEYLGISEATLPTLASVVANVEGSGVMGQYESAILGHMQAMKLSFNHRTFNKNAVILNEPRDHKIELRVAQQNRDTVSRQPEVENVKHVFIAQPISFGGGKVASATTGDVASEFAVTYWATFIDGKKVQEIDVINSIYIVNGKDWLADVRKALGN